MERIGEYLIRRLVGEGGMGKVYEAEERLSKRRVALKVLRPELGRAEQGRRLFLNEMTILAHIDHPNVVRSLACSEVDGELVMVLEYLEGRTLRQLLLDEGPLGWNEAVAIAVQIARALAAAHSQEPPIVHRDLKPENVMILESGEVKVMDFGIAKVLEALSKTTTHSVGTLQYMSPEQIDAGNLDGRSDLYCLGLLLYEMLAGRAPFESASPRELLNLQCTKPPPPLPEAVRRGLPKGVERLLLELLQKAPDDRPGSAEDVLYELEPFAPADPELAVGATRPADARSSRDSDAPSSRDSDAPSSRRGPTPSSRRRRAKRRASGSGKKQRRRDQTLRADTIALIERAASAREVPRRVGIGIVVAASLLAGIVTYYARSADEPEPPGIAIEPDRAGR